jgi:hypothetical protein
MSNQLVKKLLTLLLTFSLIFINDFVYIKTASANVINEKNISVSNNSNYDWNKIEKLLVDQIENSLKVAENFATEELDNYIEELMVNVDQKFLDWYFSFFNQKLMEYGGAISWIGFKLDEPLKKFREKDEKNLNASEVIEKRLTEDFYNKFQELVFTESAQKKFQKIIERTGNIYGSSISLVFANVKNSYKITDEDWNNHLGELAQLIYNTGNSQSSLSVESLSSSVLTETTVIGSLIGAKLFSNLAIKASTKFAIKSGASLALSTTLKLVDPLAAIAFVVWDVWDYTKMVENSRPTLRQNIFDYLIELKNNTLYDSTIGIVPILEEIQAQVMNKLPSIS